MDDLIYHHDDVIQWKHFRVTGPLRGEFTIVCCIWPLTYMASFTYMVWLPLLTWCVYCDYLIHLICLSHYKDVIMSALASQITSLTTVYSTVYSRRRSQKTSKLCVAGLCAGNSPVTGEFPAQRVSNAENVSHWFSSNSCTCYHAPSLFQIYNNNQQGCLRLSRWFSLW